MIFMSISNSKVKLRLNFYEKLTYGHVVICRRKRKRKIWGRPAEFMHSHKSEIQTPLFHFSPSKIYKALQNLAEHEFRILHFFNLVLQLNSTVLKELKEIMEKFKICPPKF